MTGPQVLAVSTIATAVEVVVVPLIALVTTGMLVRTAGDAVVATWLAAQAVVVTANLWSLGRNDLLFAALQDVDTSAQLRTGHAARALTAAERPGVWLAVAWGALAGGSVAVTAALPVREASLLAAATACAAWCRLSETMAISATRGAGLWQRAAVFSAASRLMGSAAALVVLRVGASLPIALLVQSLGGLVVRRMALPRGTDLESPPSLDLGVARSAPYFAQMAGNAVLHSLDRLVALPLLGVAGAARYGLVSQLTTPLYGVMWGAFIWVADRRVAGRSGERPAWRTVWQLTMSCVAVLVLLLAGWVVMVQGAVPRWFGPLAPQLTDRDLQWGVVAVLAFSMAVPPYYLLFRHRQGRVTAAVIVVGAVLWCGLLLLPATATGPAALAASRAVAGVTMLALSWGALVWVRRGRGRDTA